MASKEFPELPLRLEPKKAKDMGLAIPGLTR